MLTRPEMVGDALRFAVAACAAAALSGCGWSPIDAERAAFANPAAIAARGAARARLRLVGGQTSHGLNVEAADAPPPAASAGAFHDAYLRWLKGEASQLQQSSGAGGGKQPPLSL